MENTVLRGFQERNMEGSFGAGEPNEGKKFLVGSHALSPLTDRILSKAFAEITK